jgi:hypothetical protein
MSTRGFRLRVDLPSETGYPAVGEEHDPRNGYSG